MRSPRRPRRAPASERPRDGELAAPGAARRRRPRRRRGTAPSDDCSPPDPRLGSSCSRRAWPATRSQAHSRERRRTARLARRISRQVRRRRGGQAAQPVARASATHTSCIRSPASRVMRSTSRAAGTVARLSSDTAHGSGIPSEASRGTSVGMPRTVRVTSATTTLLSTGSAASRVSTRAGRRPACGCSSHRTSPRLTMALQRPRAPRSRAPTPTRRRSGARACNPPR